MNLTGIDNTLRQFNENSKRKLELEDFGNKRQKVGGELKGHNYGTIMTTKMKLLEIVKKQQSDCSKLFDLFDTQLMQFKDNYTPAHFESLKNAKLVQSKIDETIHNLEQTEPNINKTYTYLFLEALSSIEGSYKRNFERLLTPALGDLTLYSSYENIRFASLNAMIPTVNTEYRGWMELAKLFLHLENYEKASCIINSLYEVYPNSMEVKRFLIKIFLKQNDYSSALNQFQNISPEDYSEQDYLALVEIYFNKNRFLDGFRTIFDGLDKYYNSAELWNYLYKIDQFHKNIEGAYHTSATLVQLDPNNPDYIYEYFKLTSLLMPASRQNLISIILNTFEISESFRKGGSKYELLALCLLLMDNNPTGQRMEKLKNILNEAVRIDPYSYKARLILSFLYLKAKNLELAKDSAIQSTKINGQYPKAWSLLGFIYEIEGNSKMALEAYKKAVEMDCFLIHIRHKIGELQVQQKDFVAAEKTYYSLIEFSDYDGRAINMLEIVQQKMEEKKSQFPVNEINQLIENFNKVQQTTQFLMQATSDIIP